MSQFSFAVFWTNKTVVYNPFDWFFWVFPVLCLHDWTNQSVSQRTNILYLQAMYNPIIALWCPLNNGYHAQKPESNLCFGKHHLQSIPHEVCSHKNAFVKEDQWIDLEDEPDHQELCNREQRFFLKAIREDIDLTSPTEDAINSLRIAFACDESVKTGKIVSLGTSDLSWFRSFAYDIKRRIFAFLNFDCQSPFRGGAVAPLVRSEHFTR